jgi:pyruvate dehydrogenase E2 component (dihydrolipoamide acetyltransferase)
VGTEIRLAQAGMAMTEGEVMAWYKQVGDAVERGDLLAEVEAAKTTIEVEAPCSGILAEIAAEAGAVVPVRGLLAVIAEPAAKLAPNAAPDPRATSAKPAPGERRQVEPAARRLAAQLGLDLNTVAGSGPGGRIVVADVQAQAGQETESAGPPEYVASPLSGMRRTIAERMHHSLQSTAQLTMTTQADVTELARLRSSADGVSHTDLLVRACALVLAQHPGLNAVMTGTEIRRYRGVHIGIAVAVPDGLLVPVLPNADALTLTQIAQATKDLIARATAGRCSPDELDGGTFTITSLGGYGIDTFTPILNSPQVAILGVGRIAEHPSRRDGQLDWRQVMTLSLTVDHRAVDGVPAALFLQDLAGRLADPAGLFAT